MQKKVQIVPDDLGNVVRQSTKNSEFGFVRLVQPKVTYTSTGWLKNSNVSTLLHGKMEDFDTIGIKEMSELPGNIVIQEQTKPFSESDPDRDLKYAGDTGVICCTHGEPIYRKTVYDATGLMEDTLIPHTNGDAIREANGGSNNADIKKAAAKKQEEEVDPAQVDLEDSIEEIENSEETVEEVENEELDSFEL